MKFKVYKASNLSHTCDMEVNTLEELINFTKENGDSIILNTKDNIITIYDDYME